MKMIYKYAVPMYSPVFVVRMPRDAEILSVQMQANRPQFWALVDVDGLPEPREFEIVGTGDGPSDGSTYLGTWQLDEFVFHLFERMQT